jgi:hypothetical protein
MAGMLVAFLIWVKAALNLLIDKENSPRLVPPRKRVGPGSARRDGYGSAGMLTPPT